MVSTAIGGISWVDEVKPSKQKILLLNVVESCGNHIRVLCDRKVLFTSS